MRMTARHFCYTLIRICKNRWGRTIYYGGDNWGSWNPYSKRWQFDCILLIKSVLWGWRHAKKLNHGGAVYVSNGVPDYSEIQLINAGHDISFKDLVPGALLYMYGHCGIYVGRRTIKGVTGNVIESTTDGNGCVQLTRVDKSGRRWVNGVEMRSWERAGVMPWVDYSITYKKPWKF